jgi:hypothetical protein
MIAQILIGAIGEERPNCLAVDPWDASVAGRDGNNIDCMTPVIAPPARSLVERGARYRRGTAFCLVSAPPSSEMIAPVMYAAPSDASRRTTPMRSFEVKGKVRVVQGHRTPTRPT